MKNFPAQEKCCSQKQKKTFEAVNATRELTDEDEEKLFKLDELREQDPLTL